MDNRPHICTIKQLSNETGISEYTIRQWTKQGKFKVLRSGKKYLINYDVFMKYLQGTDEPEISAPTFKIRSVSM